MKDYRVDSVSKVGVFIDICVYGREVMIFHCVTMIGWILNDTILPHIFKWNSLIQNQIVGFSIQ